MFDLYEFMLKRHLTTSRVFSSDGEQENRGVELSLFGEPMQGLRL